MGFERHISMGYVHATVELSNPRLPQLEAVETQALADRGALMLCIPAAVAQQLPLTEESEREVSVADGRSIRVPYVGRTHGRHGPQHQPKPSTLGARPPQPGHSPCAGENTNPGLVHMRTKLETG